jgi:RNA polymerase sigma factor for flagellar operon FliA
LIERQECLSTRHEQSLLVRYNATAQSFIKTILDRIDTTTTSESPNEVAQTGRYVQTDTVPTSNVPTSNVPTSNVESPVEPPKPATSPDAVENRRETNLQARKERDARKAEEVEPLWKAYRVNPCIETRNALVEAYHSFAEEVSRRFGARLPRSVDRGDLITAGNVGLMNAVVGFDPERGVRFESYCELRVKGALLDELRTQDWLPRPWRQRMEHQKRSIEALRSRAGREPSDEEVANEMGLAVELYQQLFGIGLPGTPSGSMAINGSDEDVMSTLEVVPDPGAADLDDGLSHEELLSLVTKRLTEQEFRIIYLRYWEGLAMRAIGELTGLSESRVCKIHVSLIERLQDRLGVHQD